MFLDGQLLIDLYFAGETHARAYCLKLGIFENNHKWDRVHTAARLAFFRTVARLLKRHADVVEDPARYAKTVRKRLIGRHLKMRPRLRLLGDFNLDWLPENANPSTGQPRAFDDWPDRVAATVQALRTACADRFDHHILDLLSEGRNAPSIAPHVGLDARSVNRRIDRLRERVGKPTTSEELDRRSEVAQPKNGPEGPTPIETKE